MFANQRQVGSYFQDIGSRNRLYLNNGSGRFTDTTTALMPPDSEISRAVALGDVDGDGDLDLVFGNHPTIINRFISGGQNRLYLNDGTGSFTDDTAARMRPDGNFTRALALGDVDGDGDPDLVFGGENRLYFNLHRQVHTPLLPISSRTFAMDFYAKPGYGTSYHVAIAALNLTLAAAPLRNFVVHRAQFL